MLKYSSRWPRRTSSLLVEMLTEAMEANDLMISSSRKDRSCARTGRKWITIRADNAVNSSNGGCRGLRKRDGRTPLGLWGGAYGGKLTALGVPKYSHGGLRLSGPRMAAGCILNRTRESGMEIPGYICHEAAWTPPKHDRQFSAHHETRSTADIDYTAGNVARSSSRWPNSGSKCPISLNRFGVVHGAA